MHMNFRRVLPAMGIAVVVVAAIAAGIAARNGASSIVIGLVALCTLFAGIAMSLGITAAVINKKALWYQSILDAMPFMMHATDLDMNWTFMNKATAEFLSLDRNKVMGLHCSHWQAEICGTDRCSAYGLTQGRPTTFFTQNNTDFRVDTNYALDSRGEKMGFVEVVQDISSMVAMQNAQTHLVSNIRETSRSFVQASKNLAYSAQMLSSGSAEQAMAVDQLSQVSADIAGDMQRFSKISDKTLQFTHQISSKTEMGQEQMQSMIRAVDEVGEAGEAIGKALKMIKEIARQTNILAVNASIEASKAGAAGAGFAVVAEQVRYLSSKTNDYVQNISKLVNDTVIKTRKTSEIVESTAQRFAEIAQDIAGCDSMIGEVADEASSQSTAVDRIHFNIQQISNVVQQNNAISEECAASGAQLEDHSLSLEKLLDEFHKKHLAH